MKPITLEEIDKKKKNIAQSLDQLNLEKRKVERTEKEMFELHRQSLKPLRQILTLPISSKDYQVYENLIVSVEGIGAMVEEWSEGRRADIKKRERLESMLITQRLKPSLTSMERVTCKGVPMIQGNNTE